MEMLINSFLGAVSSFRYWQSLSKPR